MPLESDAETEIVTYWPLIVDPSAGLVIVTVGGVVSPAGGAFSIFTSTTCELPMFVLVSHPITWNVCGPSAYAAVSTLKPYGDAVSMALKTPSTYGFTFDMATLSVAVADTVVMPLTTEPSDGLVSETAGLVVSLTVTVNEPVLVFPRVSAAEQLTVVVAIGNVEPEAGVHVTGREPSTRSVAVAVNETTLPAELVASNVILDGNVSVGAVVSLTVMVKDPVPVLLAASVAEQFTVVVAIGNVEPEAGVHVTGTGPSTLSVAVAVYVTAAPDGPVASAVIGEGSVNTGGVVSEGGADVIVILVVVEAGDVLPALSVAFEDML